MALYLKSRFMSYRLSRFFMEELRFFRSWFCILQALKLKYSLERFYSVEKVSDKFENWSLKSFWDAMISNLVKFGLFSKLFYSLSSYSVPFEKSKYRDFKKLIEAIPLKKS